MHLLDQWLKECFISYKTASSDVLTNRRKTKHPLWLRERAQWNRFKGKARTHRPGKGLEDVLPKGEE